MKMSVWGVKLGRTIRCDWEKKPALYFKERNCLGHINKYVFWRVNDVGIPKIIISHVSSHKRHFSSRHGIRAEPNDGGGGGKTGREQKGLYS